MEKIYEDILSKRLKTLIAIRAFFVTILLGSFFIFQIGFTIFPYPYAVLYLIIFLYVLTIIYAVFLGRLKSRLFAYLQFSIDAVSVITLIFVTGGIESWFSPLMLLNVIAATIVLDKRAGYFSAILSSILYGLLIDLQYYGMLPLSYDPMLYERDFLYNIFSHISALYFTAYLIGYLSARLEKTSKKLEEKDIDLKDLALFNKEVIESVPSGLFTTDMEGRILVFNKAAESIAGVERTDAAGKNIGLLFPFIGRIRERGYTEEIMEHEGGKKVIGITISGMKDAKGSEIGFIGIFQDLTMLKVMEEEIKSKEKWAAIGELSANIAHEIRNPLASLKGAIEIIKENAVPEERKNNLMEIAISEMDRLNNIITDFLAFSRPKQLQPEEFDLNRLLGETVELLKTRNSGNVSIKEDFTGRININADPQKLQQVFWNLGINAIEAMPEGGELTVSTKDVYNYIAITFKDTGKGIPGHCIGKIFYPFFTTKENGTGLGLSIAYRIVEDHKGSMRVSSSEGRGTVFEIMIPKAANGREG